MPYTVNVDSSRWSLGQLYKRDDGRSKFYHVRIRDRRSDKAKRLSTGETAQKSAWKYVEKWCREQEAKERKAAKPGTNIFKALFDEWMDEKRTMGTREKTIEYGAPNPLEDHHYYAYGLDFGERLPAEFEVTRYAFSELFNAREFERMALSEDYIFVCRKPD